jgi:hypothetical protein
MASAQQQFFDESVKMVPAAHPANVTAEAWTEYRARVAQVGIVNADLPVPYKAHVPRPPATIDEIDEMLLHVRHPNSRMVNVKQPWASLLFGPKDVENRPNMPPPNSATDPFCYVAVVASKVESLTNKYFNDSIADAKRRVKWCLGPTNTDHPLPQSTISDDRDYYARSSQCLIGFIKFRCYQKQSWESFAGPASIWNNSDKCAWHVVSAVKFPRLIPVGTGSLGLVKLNPEPGANHAIKMAGICQEITAELLSVRSATMVAIGQAAAEA